jgi:hypothetical protein
MSRLLVGIGELQQHGLAIGQAKNVMPTGRLLLVNPDGSVIEPAKIRKVFNVGAPLVVT